MTPDAQRRFTRALRSLDGPAFVGFVAALWAARGWRPSVGPRGVVETDGDGRRESSTLRVLGTGRAAASFLAHPTEADVVVTRGRVGRVAVRAVRRLRPGVRFEHVDAAGLYQRFAHGLGDADRRRLWEDYLRTGAEHPALGVRVVSRAERARRLSSGALAAGAVLVLVVVAATSGALVGFQSDGEAASQFDGESDGLGVSNGTLTATPSPTATPNPAPEAVDLPRACPPPPADAHPVLIKPGVVRTASTSGLEGWAIRLEQNLTDFDPNDEQRSVFPSVRHLAVYESPNGRQYRLAVDRWESPDRAAAQARGSERWGVDAVLVWGSYVVTARAYADDAPDRARTDVRQLLANLQTPDGLLLGYPCVDALTGGDAQRWSNRSR